MTKNSEEIDAAGATFLEAFQEARPKLEEYARIRTGNRLRGEEAVEYAMDWIIAQLAKGRHPQDMTKGHRPFRYFVYIMRKAAQSLGEKRWRVIVTTQLDENEGSTDEDTHQIRIRKDATRCLEMFPDDLQELARDRLAWDVDWKDLGLGRGNGAKAKRLQRSLERVRKRIVQNRRELETSCGRRSKRSGSESRSGATSATSGHVEIGVLRRGQRLSFRAHEGMRGEEMSDLPAQLVTVDVDFNDDGIQLDRCDMPKCSRMPCALPSNAHYSPVGDPCL